MQTFIKPWDYLIVTASNDAQAAAYESQLTIRRQLGLLASVREILVVPDPGGRRVGSGGSTIHCLCEVLARELTDETLTDPDAWEQALSQLRVMIVHAGGDSKRLPAYGPCGKIFVPVPGRCDTAVGMTLFDRQLPTYLDLPPAPEGQGQVVITAGDVLLSFDPAEVDFSAPGMTGLGCLAPPEQASRHGVYAADRTGRVQLFLQKPDPAEQVDREAVDRYGQSILDIGVIHFDAPTAVRLMQSVGVGPVGDGRLGWGGEMGAAIEGEGLDFYREICCALGEQAGSAHHIASARGSGSGWSDALLGRLFESLKPVDFHVRVLPRCGFLHFGTTRQIISSGRDLLRMDRGSAQLETCLSMNNDVPPDEDWLIGTQAWVEGCRLRAPLTMAGRNVVVGADVEQAVELPEGACLDVIEGSDTRGQRVWFARLYGVDDSFKAPADEGGTFCNMPVLDWLGVVGAGVEDVWPAEMPAGKRTVWDARLFPAETNPVGWRKWTWMYAPDRAYTEQAEAWRKADRYSLSQIATLSDPDAFHARRLAMRARELRGSLASLFRGESNFSARELAFALKQTPDRAEWVARLLGEARWHYGGGTSTGMAGLTFGRIIHTLGSAIDELAGETDTLDDVSPGLAEAIDESVAAWLDSLHLTPLPRRSAGEWASVARDAAFNTLSQTIVASGRSVREHPTSRLRADEIVWGRAPARLDLGGGWSDTPPYTLEHGGCVINAAVNLNSQPPIHCYARMIPEPVIRVGSIDIGTRTEIRTFEDLLDYRSATSDFALAKATLAISGLDPALPCWENGIRLETMLEKFGGGLELTTLAAIPKGSGLGTSSIVGAVILATIQRVMGRTPSQQELFHGVLKVEQALTTGGGWQDQVGGAVDAVKVVRTAPGLVPDPMIQYIPGDVLDPRRNGGCTLLYYTGITRLAKNILQQVVGRYLSRDREAMQTLRQIHALPARVADAMSRKDLADFGRCIDLAWELNKQLDPNSTNERVEAVLQRVRPYVHGAKLLGAGGGGFLLMVCRSPADAAGVVDMLQADPPNELARFFAFDVSPEPLTVTVC
jgi:galactokinase/mevalonate kinase-like predicted kinase